MQLLWNLQTNTVTTGVIEEFNNRDVYAHFLVIDSTATSADVLFATFSQGATAITTPVPLVQTMADNFEDIYGLPAAGETRFYCPIPSNVFVVGDTNTDITITLTHKKAQVQNSTVVYSLINSNTYTITVYGNNITADDKEALIDEELIENNIYTTLITNYNHLVERLTADEADITDLQTIVGDTALNTTAQTVTAAVNELKADIVENTTDINELTPRVATLEGQMGTEDITAIAPTVTQAVLSLNDDIDTLQEGVVPRINRGIIDYANPTITPSAELVTALSAYIQQQFSRSPNNTDKMSVRDSESPDLGDIYTYNYWTGYQEVTDGWYWDTYSNGSSGSVPDNLPQTSYPPITVYMAPTTAGGMLPGHAIENATTHNSWPLQADQTVFTCRKAFVQAPGIDNKYYIDIVQGAGHQDYALSYSELVDGEYRYTNPNTTVYIGEPISSPDFITVASSNNEVEVLSIKCFNLSTNYYYDYGNNLIATNQDATLVLFDICGQAAYAAKMSNGAKKTGHIQYTFESLPSRAIEGLLYLSNTSNECPSQVINDYKPLPSAFTNTSVETTAFVTDTTYTDYGYRAAIALNGVTADMLASVVFGVTEAISGNYAPVAETYSGGVYIYAKAVPDSAITIPTIIITEVQ